MKCADTYYFHLYILLILFLIIGDIVSSILYGIISIFPNSVVNFIYSIGNSIYLIFGLVLSTILLIHIFKVRYLDYYVIVKEELPLDNIKNKQETTNEEKSDNKVYLEKKKEKIVIRDPKHADYRFISGMLKSLLFFVKGFTLLVALAFCISLICFVLSLIVSFLIIKTGLFFLGIFITLVACILINIITLIILFNFIIGKRSKKKYLLTSFLASTILCGVGIGLSVIGFTNFDYIDDIDNKVYLENEYIVPMQDNLIIHDHFDSEFIEEDRSDIKIIYKHTKYFTLDIYDFENNIYLYHINADSNFLETTRQSIKDINDKKIINYSKSKIYIYASKENIEKLKNNWNQYMEDENAENNYYNQLEEKNYEYEIKINELEEEIETLKFELNSYQEQ